MNRSQMIRASWDAWMSQSARPVGPVWLRYSWTFVFAAGVAAAFTVVGVLLSGGDDGAWRTPAGWGRWYLNNLVVSLTIGYSIRGLFALTRRALGAATLERFAPWQRTLYFSVVPIVGMIVGMLIGLSLLGIDLRQKAASGAPGSVAGSILFSLLVMSLFLLYFGMRARRIVAERRAAQAQLRLLQGQMEPHFLFNTLANVVGLMDADPPRAKRMLESFTDYLRASLGSLRDGEHTLGDELALVEAYLQVVKVRMEDRLSYRIDVPDALRALRLPVLSLQPLVENAVVHGLEPKIAGGQVRISAQRDGRTLRIEVSDDGLGLAAARAPASRGHGTALNNLREQLRHAHGDAGRLSVEPATPCGVRATLCLPVAD